MGFRLLHVSTDYVFDGKKNEAYEVMDETNPLNAYGRSKLLGEQAVLSYENSTVIRTSWLYGPKGNSFPKAILRKLIEGKPFQVVSDQISTPTSVEFLSSFIESVITEGITDSILHGVPTGSASWFEFAREIAKTCGFDQELISETTSEDMNVLRPANSQLASSEISGEVLSWQADWSNSKQLMLDSLGWS